MGMGDDEYVTIFSYFNAIDWCSSRYGGDANLEGFTGNLDDLMEGDIECVRHFNLGLHSIF